MTHRKFFGVSLPRTGTSSLAHAIRELGLVTISYMSEEEYEDIYMYDFANDFPIPINYKDLDTRFPGSGFIFTDRNVDDWLDSFELHWKRTRHITFGNWAEYNMKMFGTLKFDREVFREAYLRHREEVFDYFKDRPNSLLVLDIPYNQYSWTKVCNFIGADAPPCEFPHKCGSYSKSNPWCPRSEQNSQL